MTDSERQFRRELAQLIDQSDLPPRAKATLLRQQASALLSEANRDDEMVVGTTDPTAQRHVPSRYDGESE